MQVLSTLFIMSLHKIYFKKIKTWICIAAHTTSCLAKGSSHRWWLALFSSSKEVSCLEASQGTYLHPGKGWLNNLSSTLPLKTFPRLQRAYLTFWGRAQVTALLLTLDYWAYPVGERSPPSLRGLWCFKPHIRTTAHKELAHWYQKSATQFHQSKKLSEEVIHYLCISP